MRPPLTLGQLTGAWSFRPGRTSRRVDVPLTGAQLYGAAARSRSFAPPTRDVPASRVRELSRLHAAPRLYNRGGVVRLGNPGAEPFGLSALLTTALGASSSRTSTTRTSSSNPAPWVLGSWLPASQGGNAFGARTTSDGGVSTTPASSANTATPSTPPASSGTTTPPASSERFGDTAPRQNSSGPTVNNADGSVSAFPSDSRAKCEANPWTADGRFPRSPCGDLFPDLYAGITPPGAGGGTTPDLGTDEDAPLRGPVYDVDAGSKRAGLPLVPLALAGAAALWLATRKRKGRR